MGTPRFKSADSIGATEETFVKTLSNKIDTIIFKQPADGVYAGDSIVVMEKGKLYPDSISIVPGEASNITDFKKSGNYVADDSTQRIATYKMTTLQPGTEYTVTLGVDRIRDR